MGSSPDGAALNCVTRRVPFARTRRSANPGCSCDGRSQRLSCSRIWPNLASAHRIRPSRLLLKP